MPEEVMLLLLKSSLSKFGSPFNASSGMEVMELPRTGQLCFRDMCNAYTRALAQMATESCLCMKKQFAQHGQDTYYISRCAFREIKDWH